MVRWLMMLFMFSLPLAINGVSPAGEFADTMEDELIFLPEEGTFAPVQDGTAGSDAVFPDGSFVSEPYTLVTGTEAYGLAEGMYDRLPRFFGEMNKYDQIAMEPYKDTYDSMDLKEKAKVYAQQFEYMNDRKPRFSPTVLEELEQTSTDAFEAKKYLYKPPVRKKPDPKPMDLGALPGPWAKDEPAEAPPPEPALNERGEYMEYYYNEDGTLSAPADHRMETLRGDFWERRRQRPDESEE